MLFFGIKNFWFKIIVLAIFAVLSATFVLLFYRSYFIFDPFDSTLTGTAAYGHNSEGSFRRFLLLTAIEFGVLIAVLLPFSFSRFYWIRLLILQILFGGWMLLMAVAGMHGGGVDALHTLYLFAVNILIFILLVASVIAEILNRRKNNVAQNI